MDPRELIGAWHFQRQVSDTRNGTEFSASGEAEFVRESDGRIRWSEHGTLYWGAESASVSRTLYLVPDSEAAPLVTAAGDCPGGRQTDSAPIMPGWRATFEDGRDFHPWTEGSLHHLCGRDRYHGRLDAVPDAVRVAVGAEPVGPDAAASWVLTWHVTGPEKDYTMATRYTR